ncbi:hypothetical protein [Bdellovibrio bacteriovorus]|uniref:hypothetical protein n=1 Tax=Bdellovibrio bacteriovorus TaxID=959 RepID=UPI003D028A3F
MKFIYVLEDDERIQKDLFETLKNIDSGLSIRFFLSLAEFHEWLKISVTEGPKALATGGRRFADDTSPDVTPANTHELRLVIAKNEFLGVQNMGLIKRAREFFLRKKMCSPQEPTALIITAFDSPDFDISLAEERIINNVIFKPFDKLILRQHLEFALSGHHPVSSTAVASMQISSTIEMLKEVELHGINEIGFSTVNNHEIRIGAMTKYYSESFTTDHKRSVLAYCHSCKEISPKEFLCEFLFFGADNQQLTQIRKTILTDKGHTLETVKNTLGNKTRILLLDEDVPLSIEMKTFLSERFENTEVFTYSNYGQMLSDLANKETPNRQELPAQFDMIFVNYADFEVEKQKKWEQIQQYLKDRCKTYSLEFSEPPDLYMISRKRLVTDEVKVLSTWVKEIFFTPLDKTYIFKKLLKTRTSLVNKTETTIAGHKDNSALKVANPVEITQISEAGLIMKYYREISIGAFREFVLWRPEELETPEIIGTVNYTEKDKGGGDYFLNHFVFFGMKDYYLKHIRLWLREAYIKTKEK